MKSFLTRTGSPVLAALVATLTLVACGGHSDGDGAATSPTPPTVDALTLSGTAAVGARLAGRPVDVRCATGTASTVTAADGTYSVTIAGAAWPCLVRVTPSSGTVLYSLATSTGTSATANITSATQLVLAEIAAVDLATFFAAFDSSHASAITATAIAAAQAQVVAALQLAGVDFTSIGDLLAAAFSPAYDAALDTFAAALARSGTTLDTLTTRFIAAGAPVPVTLPADLLLKPAAANCSALRSTSYRILTPINGAALALQSSVISLDAATLTVTHVDGTRNTWAANGATCRFSEQHGTYSADIAVSQAGVLAARYSTDGITFRSYVGFPEQTHALAELAGDWNVLGLTRAAPNTYTGVAGGFSFDATGHVTAASNCQNNATWAVDVCASVPASLLSGALPLGVDSAGGFDSFDTSTLAVFGRLFAYKSGGGELILATVDADGELYFLAPVRSNALPAVGAVSTSWNIDNTPQLTVPSAIYATTATVTAVNTAAGSWNRNQQLVGATATRPEVLFINNPRPGYFHRPSATVTASDGTSVVINEYTALRWTGSGLTPLILLTPTGKLFELSLTQP